MLCNVNRLGVLTAGILFTFSHIIKYISITLHFYLFIDSNIHQEQCAYRGSHELTGICSWTTQFKLILDALDQVLINLRENTFKPWLNKSQPYACATESFNV